MTSIDIDPTMAPRADRSGRLAPALFATTLFLSALLLFAVQPMFTKMVLPKLGGAPSVWSVAMVAFQGFLFLGYLYAHGLARWLSPARAALTHLAVLAAVALTLPLGISPHFTVPPTDGVTLWLVGLFAASIGLPFVALSASAPLLQAWFVATGHKQAHNPYVLYAASNLGSFAALIAYPFLIEPFLTLQQQALLWSAGFAALALTIAASAGFAGRAPRLVASAAHGASPSLAQRLYWCALMAVPAGLGIAVTAYITTDLAAAPFLWIIPLALYLLTFVAVFRERPWIAHEWVLRLLPFVLAPLAISLLGGEKVNWLTVAFINLTAFTLIALACHGEAYRRRPEAARLTDFYLWTSFGGVVGGIFAGLAAPHLFNNIYEYPILIVAALVVLPGAWAEGPRRLLQESGPLVLLAVAVLVARFGFGLRLPPDADMIVQIGLILLAMIMLVLARKPSRFVGYVVLCFAISGSWLAGAHAIETVRSFFGVHQVVESADRSHLILFHGTTIHGAEKVRHADGTPLSGRPEPLTYYYFGGPMSDAIAAARAAQGGRLGAVAVVGLGTGSLACHRQPGENWTYYEIDPEVIRLARDSGRFHFLSSCAPDAAIVPGDARLTLAASPARYDLIVLDAFSSDAIPVHLLTREAFAAYRAHLAPHGVIAVHVSNRHMELARVVAAVGAADGLVAVVKQDDQATQFLKDYRANAQVVALARAAADLGDLPQRTGWQKLPPSPSVAAWSDDYSNIIGAIIRKKRGL